MAWASCGRRHVASCATVVRFLLEYIALLNFSRRHPMLDPQSTIPQIDRARAPKDESDDIWLLNMALRDIEKYAKQFGAALHLFEYCVMQMSVMPTGRADAFFSWMLLACRECVMSIWHFRKEITAANNCAKKSLYVGPQLDGALLHAAHSKFDKYFPDFAASRNAVAHAGEFAKNKASYEANAFSGSYEGPAIRI